MVNAVVQPFFRGLYGIYIPSGMLHSRAARGESDKQPRVETVFRYGSLIGKRHITAQVRQRGLMTQN
jgi:hypothetical protein